MSPLEKDLSIEYLGKKLGINKETLVNELSFKEDLITTTFNQSDNVEENKHIEINEEYIRIETYRACGAGGQHVNKTDSAVRITHFPSSIVVQCQNDRSQHKNKETCMNMLKARLYEFELQKKEKESSKIENNKSDIGWGHQIRSYAVSYTHLTLPTNREV